MAMNFPDSPVLDEVYVDPSGVSYSWNGYGWQMISGGGSVTEGSWTKLESDSRYVDILGDTMLGNLNHGDGQSERSIITVNSKASANATGGSGIAFALDGVNFMGIGNASAVSGGGFNATPMISVQGDLLFNVSGTIKALSGAATVSPVTGAVVISGGLGVGKEIRTVGSIYAGDGTQNTVVSVVNSASGGANGGGFFMVQNAGMPAMTIGNKSAILNLAYSTTTMIGSEGPLEIAVNNSNPVKVVSTLAASSKVTGALQVAGGLGVSGTIFASNLQAVGTNPGIVLNKSGNNDSNWIYGLRNNVPRWTMHLGTSGAETGNNSGSDFGIYRQNDAGVDFANNPGLSIRRSDGWVTMGGGMASTAGRVMSISGTTTPAVSVSNILASVNSTWGMWLYVKDALAFGTCSPGGDPFNAYHTMTSTYYMSMGYVCAGNNGNFYMGTDSGSNRLQLSLGFGLDCILASGDMMLYAQGERARWRYSDNAYLISGGAYKPGGGAWADSSDGRIKDVIGDYKSGLEQIAALRPVSFTFKGNDTVDKPALNPLPISADAKEAPIPRNDPIVVPYENSPHHAVAKEAREYIGLIAQDVEAIMPEMVTKRKGFIDGKEVTDLRDLDTTPLIFALINSIKELKARIEVLEGTATSKQSKG